MRLRLAVVQPSRAQYPKRSRLTTFFPNVPILFSYLMVVGAIDWNICPEVLGITNSSIARGHPPSAIEPLVIRMTKGQMFQSVAPEAIK